MGFYLGVDGGQSSTTALIADDTGRVVGSGSAGPCNHVEAAEARAKFAAVIGTCVSAACREAAIDPEKAFFAAACFGFSGGAEDKTAYTLDLVRSRLYEITHDAQIALTGATGGKPGIVAIAGTGSIAFGRNRGGETARAGGWGYAMGDEGGAFDIARQALRAGLQHEEGWGPATVLTDSLKSATGCKSMDELLHRFYANYGRKAFAALAPLVTEAAEMSDEVAAHILERSAAALGWYVEGVYRKLFVPESAATVSFVGGVFRSQPLLRFFRQSVADRIGCAIADPLYSPAAGALMEAMRLDSNTSPLSNLPERIK